MGCVCYTLHLSPCGKLAVISKYKEIKGFKMRTAIYIIPLLGVYGM